MIPLSFVDGYSSWMGIFWAHLLSMASILPEEDIAIVESDASKHGYDVHIQLSNFSGWNTVCTRCHKKTWKMFHFGEKSIWLCHNQICSQPVCTTYHIKNGGCGDVKSIFIF